ncbi:MAG: ParB/RepB/Spo0J family partition protein [Planctomycetota bacterium]|nr:ParB/RepB/Spo0J family partition protein [Planctomycetota bacterium]MDA1211540.1 ParB/RepB/Spo0J family partition protein [Planctomycetota bacterium]
MGQGHSEENREQGRKRLGRGLHALLGDDAPVETTPPSASATPEGGSGLSQIPCDQIERNPYQPRTQFGDDALAELASSIQQHGVLQPLLVRKVEQGYQLIAGERRLLAARKAEIADVPCRVMAYDDQQVCEAALEENLKREDLNDLEKARAFQSYMKTFDMSIEKLAKRLSCHRTTVSNLLRLLELPEATQEALLAGQISSGHARAMISLSAIDQQRLCLKIVKEGLSVRQTEQAVRTMQEPNTVPFEKPAEPIEKPEVSYHILSLQNQLRDLTGTKVTIRQTGKNSGEVILHFDTNDDFERILRVIRRPAA